MKTYAGSLQRRGRRWYLVVHKDGRQRWFALKTDKLPVARMRAARIAPADPDDERAWLEQLVREGERARGLLARRKAVSELTWENLQERVAASVDVAASADCRDCHAHWLDVLVSNVRSRRRDARPGTLTSEDAVSLVGALAGRYRSMPRMLGFFRRVWREVGLDPDVWPARTSLPAATGGEHYRRLSSEEVRKVHAGLVKGAPALADMVLVGYSTGLRLSDVAELELSELDLPFLRVVPNKTRRRKPHPLRIPLTEEALAAVVRLKLVAEGRGLSFLFNEQARHRPSRRLSAAFRAAGVGKLGTGRASFHSLRATFISLMDEAGVPPHVTDAITGHGGGGMHARYTQPCDEALRAAVARAVKPLGSGGGSNVGSAFVCRVP